MCLVSEINALRLITVILLVILIGLSFYLVVQSWNCCEALTVRLNEELEDFRNLMRDSDNEEYIIRVAIFTGTAKQFKQNI